MRRDSRGRKIGVQHIEDIKRIFEGRQRTTEPFGAVPPGRLRQQAGLKSLPIRDLKVRIIPAIDAADLCDLRNHALQRIHSNAHSLCSISSPGKAWG